MRDECCKRGVRSLYQVDRPFFFPKLRSKSTPPCLISSTGVSHSKGILKMFLSYKMRRCSALESPYKYCLHILE